MGGILLGDMSWAGVDLDAYCRRVGYAGPRSPTVSTLRELLRLHPAAIPYDAIDARLGVPISLAPAVVDAKLIGARRGGYCFEQNTLLLRVLLALGFQAEPLSARPRWRRPLHEHVPRTHMAVRVRVDGRDWIADVGFGSCMLTAPLDMAVTGPQETTHEPARIVPLEGELRVERLLGGEWLPLYDLLLAPQRPVDLVAANWLISTHPASSFHQNLVVSRTRDEVRHVLVNTRLTTRRSGAEVEYRDLDAAGLEQSLIDDFGLPIQDNFRRLFSELASPGK
ncbi:MAG TPA: arylamine N-acetyltransferase [Polyangiaceae bacterium]|nr:arylamine N-acetyltransferase [Polyangiaceae bacterium]